MRNKILVVIGLGYVGLPIAIKFSKKIKTYGFDKNISRIKELQNGYDKNGEYEKKLLNNKFLIFTNKHDIISEADYIIIAVPTPITKKKRPDFTPLNEACKIIGKNLKKKTVIIFESTVYPGATKEKCIPVIEKYSKKIWKKDFFVGYSPERANVGDKTKSFEKIIKIISGDSEASLKEIEKLYTLVTNKLYKVEEIEIAEAAKSLENTQRDINIGLMNEFSIICEKLNLNTKKVIDAAATKWNFNLFYPGLVGGHCISIDPYYLSYKSEKLNFTPKIINSSRKVNDYMPNFIKQKVLEVLKNKKKKIKILICGLTFKENCKDIRNSKIFDLVRLLKKTKMEITLHDPYANEKDINEEYNEKITSWKNISSKFDILIISIKHKFYINLGVKKLYSKVKKNGFIFDIKSSFESKKYLKKNKINYWSL